MFVKASNRFGREVMVDSDWLKKYGKSNGFKPLETIEERTYIQELEEMRKVDLATMCGQKKIKLPKSFSVMTKDEIIELLINYKENEISD